jgi:ribosomal protein L36
MKEASYRQISKIIHELVVICEKVKTTSCKDCKVVKPFLHQLYKIRDEVLGIINKEDK